MQPFVVCICPTYNREKFLPQLLYMFNYQTYPSDRRHLIIYDDSPKSNELLIKNRDNNITYIYDSDKKKLGYKRNKLNELAINMKAEYIMCLDDDDYYPSKKISYTITRMQATKAQISGTSKIFVWYTKLNKCVSYGPYNDHHCTNGTMCYTSKFIIDNDLKYDNEADKSEEKFFLKDYSYPILQLEPFKVILCINHGSNTVDKVKFLEYSQPHEQKLKKLINDNYLLQFYKNLD